MKGKRVDVLFTGDSITAGWLGAGKRVWDRFYAPRNPLDFGVPGDTTGNVLWRLDTMDVKDFHPEGAGAPDRHEQRPEHSRGHRKGVRAILDKTQAMSPPGLKTILVSIMPNARANQKMMDADAIIRHFADNQTVFYLDLVPLMPPVNGTHSRRQARHELEGPGQGPPPSGGARLPDLGRRDGAAPQGPPRRPGPGRFGRGRRIAHVGGPPIRPPRPPRRIPRPRRRRYGIGSEAALRPVQSA